MIFAVVSDSHGEIKNVGRLAVRLNRAGIKTALHLGDDYQDAGALLAAGLEVLRVPGVYSEYYRKPDIPNRLVTELSGLKIMLTHSDQPHENDLPEDRDPAELAAEEKPDLVFFGHSHLPVIEERDGVVWVNPGHLKAEDKKGSPPSYALVDASAGPPRVTILSLEDETVLMEK